jgi:hypothetical protein
VRRSVSPFRVVEEVGAQARCGMGWGGRLVEVWRYKVFVWWLRQRKERRGLWLGGARVGATVRGFARYGLCWGAV